jgi:hypothetical protein
MNHSEWLQQLIDLLHTYHFTVAHFRSVRQQRADGSVFWSTPVQADGTGWPDLVAVRDKRIVVIEAKVGRDKLSDEQRHWLDILEMAGAESYVFFPSDWDEAVKVLGR